MDKCTEIHTTMIADEQIIELYWQRNEKALHETEGKYGKMLFRIAYNILHDRSDCEECQNDTLLAIWNCIPPTRPVVFSAFISKIMRNIATGKYRDRSRQKRIPAEMTVSLDELSEFLHENDSPEADYVAKEIGKLISEYVRTLSDKQHYIFIGRFYFCERLEFLADELGVNVSTVQRNVENIKVGLKKHLERNGVYI